MSEIPPTPPEPGPRTPWQKGRATWRRLHQKRWFRWSVDLALLAVVLSALMGWQTRKLPRGDTPLPELALRTMEGAPASLSALQGKPVVLELWAPWCGVCRAQASSMRWLKRAVGDSAHVVSIATAYRDEASVRRFIDDHEVDFPVYLGGADVQQALGVDSFPTLLFISADGRIQHAAVGFTTLPGLLWRLWRTG